MARKQPRNIGTGNNIPPATRRTLIGGRWERIAGSRRQRFILYAAGAAALLGVVMAYNPALGDNGTWTSPYTGSAGSSGALINITNTTSGGASDGIDAYVSGNGAAGFYGVNNGVAGGFGTYGFTSGSSSYAAYGTTTGNNSYGVYGISLGTNGYGVYGYSSATTGYGVYGRGSTHAVYGTTDGSNSGSSVTAAGLFGTGSAATAIGVAGSVNSSRTAIMAVNSGSGTGLSSSSAGGYGVYGSTSGTNAGSITAAGVFGSSATATGVAGMSGSGSDPAVYGSNTGTGTGGAGVYGQSANGFGIYGTTNRASAAGIYGTNAAGGAGVIGIGDSANSPTGYFLNNNAFGNAVGLQGQCNAGLGVVGYGRVGVYGAPLVSGGYAGYFQGDVQVTGTLSAATKHFKIDHPLDPAHKYLVHASIESSEMLNIYRGNVVLDSDGRATVQMPDWFQAENGDCSYNLTCVGGYAPVYLARELDHNQFDIAGGKPGLKVSWQVTGVRQDAYATHHPLQVEQAKTGEEDGRYLDPEDYGKPDSARVSALPAAFTGVDKLPTMHTPSRMTLPTLLKIVPSSRKPLPPPPPIRARHTSAPRSDERVRK